MTDQLNLLPSAASEHRETIKKFKIDIWCYGCGHDAGYISKNLCGDYTLQCRNCNRQQKRLSRAAVEFLIVCDIAVAFGASIETIRAACSDTRGKIRGPLNIALQLLEASR